MAGRRLLKDEVTKQKVIDLSWTTLSQALRSAKVPASEKRRIALELCKKTAPQDLNVKAGVTFIDLISVVHEHTEGANRTGTPSFN